MSEQTTGALTLDSLRGRLVLGTVILGSGIALLDATVVNIALRRIGTDLGAALTALQWVSNGYLLSLASLILVGGALGDRLGRRRVYLAGVIGFGLGSGLCALAQDPVQLVGFRVLQGVAAALLAPGGLAILQSTFAPQDRPAAIGTWAGVSGLATAVGPFLGGLLVEHAGWRWIFAINLPLCLAVVLLGLRVVPESRDEETSGRFDVLGAVVAVLALGSTTYVLTAWRSLGAAQVLAVSVLAVVAWVVFLLLERRPHAMAPVALFSSRVFAAANAMTMLVYGALGTVLFFLVLQLQTTLGWSPVAAGAATLPITVVMLLLSSRLSVLAARLGPRVPMAVGPVLCATGTLLLSRVGPGASYVVDVFPGITVFALGLASLVSPLTVTVLAAVPDSHAGVASGINNAVARAGSLLAVAALPALVGLGGQQYADPQALTGGYRRALVVAAAMLLLGGAVSWFGLRGTGRRTPTRRTPTEETP
ncbi:MAG: major facilitator transporter [Marmoricola sp.]|nr:major facilitator transporter [Marmoricola sp.]